MELSWLLYYLSFLFNTLIEISISRPTINDTVYHIFNEKTNTKKMGLRKEYEYDDDYEEPFDSFVQSKTDNILDTVLMPPGLGISKETLKIQSETKSPAPEYMMELYEKFSKNKLNQPKSNIVRSFMNINDKDNQIAYSNSIQSSVTATRVHTLVFNITSVSPDETIDLAELRLFTLVEKDRNTYIGVDRKVSCLEVLSHNTERYRLIESKHIYGRHSGWETFDVTSAVRHWVTDINIIQILEIRIESVFHGFSMGNMDINVKNANKKEPLLVVFSSETKINGLHRTERHELVTREMDSVNVISSSSKSLTNSSEHIHISNNDHKSAHKTDNLDSPILSRVKRRGRRQIPCHRRPMYIRFSDINWDNWIIAPHGYQAYQCVGRCYFPLSDHLSPTKYAIIKGLLHSAYPDEYSRACCVPTKLDPISILYIDEQGVPTYKYKYDGMVVSECGCR
ncbi:bone morphogenetic protein 10-like [Mytilus galloprovincialis]|uniref:bone morphogenetic protein 10-like n=1 Tax=Mytilus galloprovincialis TaxID=29158 RepID=UPI003F7B8EED